MACQLGFSGFEYITWVGREALLLWSFDAGDAAGADAGAMAGAGGEDREVAGLEVDVCGLARSVALVGKGKADGATHTVEHFLIAVTMGAVFIMRAVGPG